MKLSSVSKLDLIQARVTCVPEGWELCRVSETLNIRNNLRKPISQEVRNTIKGDFPYYGPTKIQGYISEYEQDGTYALIGEDGDHFLKYATMPQTQYISGKCTVNNHAHIVESSETCSSEWFFNYFKHRDITNFLSRQGAGRFKLNKATLEKLPLLVPPPPEQRKIAKILSTWDKAISTTEKLIATSKQQKKALMQQLLTGKKRLRYSPKGSPETGKTFNGEWEDKYLNEFSKVIVSPVDKKTVEGEIPVELCNYTDVYYNTNITNKLTFMKATAKQSEIDKFTLEVGDVIITKDSETPGDIAVPALVSEDLNGVVCGYHLAIIRTDKEQADGAFINYLFSTPKTRYYFFTLATGATRFGLSIGGINKAHFKLPPLEEQQKIASVLTAADKETEVLQAKLAHLKQEKKALMQQLLTGKRRVKTDEELAQWK